MEVVTTYKYIADDGKEFFSEEEGIFSRTIKRITHAGSIVRDFYKQQKDSHATTCS